MSFEEYVNETYLAPYTTGKSKSNLPRQFYLLPRRLVYNTPYEPYFVREAIRLAENLGQITYALCPFVSFSEEDCTSISYIGKPSERVLIFADGKFLSNRGNPTNNFSLMTLRKAIEISLKLDKFSYAVINWRTITMLPFMLSERAFRSADLNDIMRATITTYHLGVSMAFKEIAKLDWCFADEFVTS